MSKKNDKSLEEIEREFELKQLRLKTRYYKDMIESLQEEINNSKKFEKRLDKLSSINKNFHFNSSDNEFNDSLNKLKNLVNRNQQNK